MGLYFKGDAWIEMSATPGVMSGTPVPGTDGVTGVAGGVKVSIAAGNEGPPDFSDVQPVNRTAIMMMIPARVIDGLMIR